MPRAASWIHEIKFLTPFFNTAFYCKVRLFFLGVLCRVVSRKEEPSDEAVADVEADADADA